MRLRIEVRGADGFGLGFSHEVNTEYKPKAKRSSYAEPYIIPTVPHEPWAEKNIPIPLKVREQVLDLLRQRLRTGLYERAESPYSSKWFCVPKKDGKLRLVHGVERMSSITIKDAGVPPVLQPFVENIVGRKAYGLFDIMGGFE